ncbi:MAG: hypothetical protein WDO68_30750 [Gammaproteobacteria bacterium]
MFLCRIPRHDAQQIVQSNPASISLKNTIILRLTTVDDIHRRVDTPGPRMEIVMALPAKKITAEESMEARIARLEATTEHIQSDVKSLRQEMKELNTKLDTRFEQIQKSFESLRIGRVLDRVWMLLSMGAMLGVMARGFKWI